MSIDEVTERRGALSPAKQALLARLVRGGATAVRPDADAIRPRADAGPAPLSASQQRLWFLHQMEPASAAYGIAGALRLRGALDAAALDRALTEIVRRHHALRTVFPRRDGEPVQVVQPAPASVLRIDDASGLDDEDARGAEASRRAGDEAARPFDLERGPLFRATLVKLADDDHLLLLTQHHIVTDGWSRGVLYREMAALYTAFFRGEPSPLPELALQYADFAAWQRARLDGPALEAHLDYWRTALAGAPALLELPADRPRPAVQGSRGAGHPFALPRALVDRLAEVARGEEATLFMALMAGLDALLHRYTGARDVVVGTPSAGRTREETEPLIGFFLNTLAVRVDLSGDPTFREVLRRVRAATLGAYAHQEVPFERLVDALKVERSLSHPPVFQVMLTLHNAAGEGLRLPGLAVEPVAAEVRSAQVDLTLYLEERGDGLEGMLQYAADLFDAPTVARMGRHLRALLDGAAADPGLRLSELPLLAEDEHAQVVTEPNDTDAPYAAVPVHLLVASQAARTPDTVAVRCGGETLTYAALDAASSRLARHLAGLGVARGERVALSMERSPALLVAMLAAWKAGAAYVPIDPAYPAERRAYMLADCGAAVVLTDAASADGLPATDAPAVTVDTLDLADADDSAPGVVVDADDLAYVIYTSGSTGRPKGVMVPHRGVANFLASMAREPGIGEDDVLLAVTSLSFDIAVLELLLPLTAGAQVALATRDEAMDAARLAALLERTGATVMQATPATWRLLVQSGWRGKPDLALLSGGEALAPELARELLPRGRALWNLYGPTETTIWSAAQRVETADAIALGRPIANTRLYVLDPALRPCPVGVPGELYIGGEGVVRGYLHRPALTAERFVPDPFADGDGARLYRTGDRVRWRESALVRECVSAGVDPASANSRTNALTHSRTSSALEFLGRIDFQVKVRGFRIELGEIEAALAEHPGVRECVAVVREDTPGDARIVAYLVAEGAAPEPEQLRRALARRLPDYMLPSAYVALDALPLTPNGKTDRGALPAPEAPRRDPARFVPPRTPAETAIAGFWREALGMETVGAEDNFFEIGGHSLLLAKVHARVRGAFPREVTMVEMFRHPTVRALAAFLETHDAPGAAATPSRGLDRAEARRAMLAQGPRRGAPRP
jgi:amino acid adenylation domain-containing protein